MSVDWEVLGWLRGLSGLGWPCTRLGPRPEPHSPGSQLGLVRTVVEVSSEVGAACPSRSRLGIHALGLPPGFPDHGGLPGLSRFKGWKSGATWVGVPHGICDLQAVPAALAPSQEHSLWKENVSEALVSGVSRLGGFAR